MKTSLLSILAIGVFFLSGAHSDVVASGSSVESSDKDAITLPNYRLVGFMQQHFVVDESPDSATRFSIYRARIGFSGQVTDRIRVNIVGGLVEPPSSTPRLVNAVVDFDLHPMLQIRTGQFLVPFGLEGPEVITFNPAIERSLVMRRTNTFNMFRDAGVQLSGRSDAFTYAVAVVNGVGANNPEQIEPKDILGRIGYDITNTINIGLSGHYGQYRPDASLDNEEARYRFAADFSYTGDPVFFRGEYIYREDERPDMDSRKWSGFYVLGGYNFTRQIQGIARFEYLIPDTDGSDNELSVITLGANYRFAGNTRVSANYEIRNDELNPNLKNLFTIQMQVAL